MKIASPAAGLVALLLPAAATSFVAPSTTSPRRLPSWPRPAAGGDSGGGGGGRDAPAPTWDGASHVESSSGSWTGARFGDANPDRPAAYTASETRPGGGGRLGVDMNSHVEAGGASWTGARFGDPYANRPALYTASETRPGAGGRLGVKIESHVEAGGASWTGARFGDEGASSSQPLPPPPTRRETTTTTTTKPHRGPGPTSAPGRGRGLSGTTRRASWTEARFGDANPDRPTAYVASETRPRGGGRLGVNMEAHVEAGGASWTGARFGDEGASSSPPPRREVATTAPKSDRGEGPASVAGKGRASLGVAADARPPGRASRTGGRLGAKMEAHVEAGGASWTGARFGDPYANRPAAYTASETRPGADGRLGVKIESHVEAGGASWTGARLGDDDEEGRAGRGAAPTPSRWHE